MLKDNHFWSISDHKLSNVRLSFGNDRRERVCVCVCVLICVYGWEAKTKKKNYLEI